MIPGWFLISFQLLLTRLWFFFIANVVKVVCRVKKRWVKYLCRWCKVFAVMLFKKNLGLGWVEFLLWFAFFFFSLNDWLQQCCLIKWISNLVFTVQGWVMFCFHLIIFFFAHIYVCFQWTVLHIGSRFPAGNWGKGLLGSCETHL